MDKNAIKKYAVWARRELISRVSQRAALYEITDKGYGDASADSVLGRVMSAEEKRQRQALIAQIREKGYEQVMEEIAYTWFNRFIALRFMEVNGYLPSRICVFTDDENNFKPQILAEAINMQLDGLDMEKVYALKNANDDDALFKYMIIVQCNALSSILPGLFQRISDFTELLFPDNLLREGSVIEQMVAMIPEDNFDVSSEDGQIEIIGWLYQYYISEKHEEVVDPLHGKVVKKEEVPAATQLFTTDWVVRYLIDNSVGRYWIERNPGSTLADKLTYFVKPKDGTIKTVNEKITPQDVTTFDPCVGSGHFLIYAFDVLMKIYVEYGYSERDAAAEIVKNNLFGLDIDGRASQLAYFSVMMKARQYDRRFFSRGIQPHVYEIMESNTAEKSSIEHFCGSDDSLKKDIEALLDALKDAKEYGSILQMPVVDFGRINARFAQLEEEISIFNTYLRCDFKEMIRPAEIMSRQYAVIATNPPYLNKYDQKLKEYVNNLYKPYSGDLFSVFMYRNFAFCERGGYCSFMTPFVWMFIKTYENLRKFIITEKAIITLIQMEYSAFEEATVPICAFVLGNNTPTQNALCFKLSAFRGGMEVQNRKTLEAINNPKCNFFFESNQMDYLRIPASPIAYWASEQLYEAFEQGDLLDSLAHPKKGLATTDNNRFLRLWHEVSSIKMGVGFSSAEEAQLSGKKWFPLNKGGDYRRWYGNKEFLVNWENDGAEMKDAIVKRYNGGSYTKEIRSESRYFSNSITWSALTAGTSSFRHSDYGALFDSAGSSMFPEKHGAYILAFLNSKVSDSILKIINPTLNYGAGSIANLPVVFPECGVPEIEDSARRCVELAREDWNSFETSWDFTEHPFVSAVSSMTQRGEKVSLKKAFEIWKIVADDRFNELKTIEEELNRTFINIYGLSGELNPEIDDKEISVRKADLQRDVLSFISYAVGCMFGRFTLGEPGLIFAGGDWDSTLYTQFHPDKDAIIPICDDEYFEDDIVGRFVKFVEAVCGKESLEENLRFIADALGGKGSSREIIRNYFINNFYADHLKTYQKRPIYWLFDSGKKNGFKCLIYMHRYQPDTIARIRTDYVHEQQSRYRTAIADLESRISNSGTSERVKLSKQLTKLQEQAEELRIYEEKIHHLADQMIRIDLDDGVKHNYSLFQDVLAKIK